MFSQCLGSFKNFLFCSLFFFFFGCTYSLPGLTKVTQKAWLKKKQKPISSQFWNLDVQDRGVSRVDFFWGLSHWFVVSCPLPGSSRDLPSVLGSSACKNISHIAIRLIHMISFYLNYFFKCLISKCSHISKIRTSPYKFRGDTLPFICKSKEVYPWKRARRKMIGIYSMNEKQRHVFWNRIKICQQNFKGGLRRWLRAIFKNFIKIPIFKYLYYT